MTVDVLAIAAHPDDVEQTCGGTLIRMAEAGYRTAVADLTAGEMGTRGSPEQRAREAQKAAEIMLLSQRDNLHLPDARLENTLDARLKVAAGGNRADFPEFVLTGQPDLDVMGAFGPEADVAGAEGDGSIRQGEALQNRLGTGGHTGVFGLALLGRSD